MVLWERFNVRKYNRTSLFIAICIVAFACYFMLALHTSDAMVDDTVEFHDNTLKLAVEMELVNKGIIVPGEPITIQHLKDERFTSLSLYSALQDQYIHTIDALIHAIHLENIELVNQQIVEINALAHLPNLKHLDLSNNQISDLSPLSELSQLEKLFLSSNEVSNLEPLTSLDDLTHLHLEGNRITDLAPLASMTSLTHVDLSSNQITHIDALAHHPSIDFLYIDGNRISDFSPLLTIDSLGYVEIGNNAFDYDPELGVDPESPVGQVVEALELREVYVRLSVDYSYFPYDASVELTHIGGEGWLLSWDPAISAFEPPVSHYDIYIHAYGDHWLHDSVPHEETGEKLSVFLGPLEQGMEYTFTVVMRVAYSDDTDSITETIFIHENMPIEMSLQVASEAQETYYIGQPITLALHLEEAVNMTNGMAYAILVSLPEALEITNARIAEGTSGEFGFELEPIEEGSGAFNFVYVEQIEELSLEAGDPLFYFDIVYHEEGEHLLGLFMASIQDAEEQVYEYIGLESEALIFNVAPFVPDPFEVALVSADESLIDWGSYEQLTVAVRDEHGNTYEVKVDEEGIAIFDALPAGTWDILLGSSEAGLVQTNRVVVERSEWQKAIESVVVPVALWQSVDRAEEPFSLIDAYAFTQRVLANDWDINLDGVVDEEDVYAIFERVVPISVYPARASG